MRVVDNGGECVEQTWIVAVPVLLVQSAIQLLSGVPAQVFWPLDAQAHQHPGDGRTDIGDGFQFTFAHNLSVAIGRGSGLNISDRPGSRRSQPRPK